MVPERDGALTKTVSDKGSDEYVGVRTGRQVCGLKSAPKPLVNVFLTELGNPDVLLL